MRAPVAALVAVLALCALAAATAAPLPARPAPLNYGRFAHEATLVPSKAAALRRGSSSDSDAAPAPAPEPGRRFVHSAVIDVDGLDVTDLYAVPDSFDAARTRAAELAPLGLSVLKYDVELAQSTRVLDEDENVLAVSCAAFNAESLERQLVLTVADPAAALARYGPGSVVHGSEMWGCVDGSGTAWSILARVESVAQSAQNEHEIQVRALAASYQDLFIAADVMLSQPSLAAEGDSEEAKSERMHAQALARRSELQLTATSDAAQTRARQLEREQQFDDSHRDRRAMRKMDNELQISSPQYKQLYSPTDSIRITFTGFGRIPQPNSGDTTLELKRVEQGSDDRQGPKIRLPACETPFNGDECTFVVSLSQFDPQPRLQGYYFRIEYCDDGFLGIEKCDHTNSPTFWIPIQSSGSFAQKGLATYEQNCDKQRDTCANPSNAPFLTRAMCALCTQGRDMRFRVECDDCRVEYSALVPYFSFGYSLDPFDLFIYSEVQVDASVDANVDLLARIDLRQQLGGKLTVLDRLAIPPSISLKLGVVSVTIGATFSLSAGYSLDFRAAATARATAAMKNVLTARAKYDTRSNPRSELSGSIPPFAFHKQPTLRIDASAEASVRFYLQPVLSVGINHLLEAWAQTDLGVNLHANFSWPAYPALPAGKAYNPFPREPYATVSSACDAPHLVRFGVDGGLSNSYAAARLDFDIGSRISPILEKFDIERDLGRWDFNDVSLPLVSGCLLKQKSSEPFVLRFRLPATKALNFSWSGDLQLANVVFNLAADLSRALDVPATRFAISLLDELGRYIDEEGNLVVPGMKAQSAGAITHPLRRNVLHSSPRMSRPAASASASASTTKGGSAATAEVVILDSDDPAAPTSATLVASIKTQMGNPDSELRQGVVAGGMELEKEGGGSGSNAVAIGVGVTFGVLGALAIALGVYYMLVLRPKRLAAAGAAAGGSEEADSSFKHMPSPSPSPPPSVSLTPWPVVMPSASAASGVEGQPRSMAPAPLSAAARPPMPKSMPPPPPVSPDQVRVALTPPPPPPPAAASSTTVSTPRMPQAPPPPPPAAAAAVSAPGASPRAPGKLDLSRFQHLNKA